SKDGKRAYYSSVREDGMGYTDIYMITIPEGIKNVDAVATKPPIDVPQDTTATVTDNNVIPIVIPPKKDLKALKYIVTVVDAGDKTPIDAKIRLQGSKDNVIVPMESQGGGVYQFSITNAKAKDYRLSVEASGYVFVNQTFKLDGASTQERTVNRTVELRKIAVGVSSILRNIYFDFDKATFKTESYSELNKLESMLVQNGTMTVEIAGHTDAVGTKEYNQYLSLKRAQAVKDYLTKKGIDSRRVKPVGYGKSKPLASNDDETGGRELNRRVEFKVLQQ
ncbi:MAG TPA: OmpA family protein, partial [Chryseolinea sp.]|nr:OmpA family protein [Chryseolinea sp.]